MPRALTEKEKCMQCQRLLEKGKQVVMLQGMRKVSIEDIAKAAGMAKGTFYQHFDSKEQYLFALVEKIHHEMFKQAKHLFVENPTDKALTKEKLRSSLQELFLLPEMLFFIQNEQNISILMESSPKEETQSFRESEELLFAEIISLAGIDITKIKPGVVHNFVHTLFIVQGSDLMVEDDIPKTLDLLMNSLISYLFEETA